MITPRISVDGVKLFIVPSGFVFVRQTCVKFYGKRLSKNELIKCCDYFISELKHFYSIDRLKIGFNLKSFKYYELSVYLHGLISLLCSNIECSCPSCFYLFRFSHLPHEILKSEKETKSVECVHLHSPHGVSYYVCFTDTLVFATSFERLKEFVNKTSFARKYDIVFDIK